MNDFISIEIKLGSSSLGCHHLEREQYMDNTPFCLCLNLSLHDFCPVLLWNTNKNLGRLYLSIHIPCRQEGCRLIPISPVHSRMCPYDRTLIGSAKLFLDLGYKFIPPLQMGLPPSTFIYREGFSLVCWT